MTDLRRKSDRIIPVGFVITILIGYNFLQDTTGVLGDANADSGIDINYKARDLILKYGTEPIFGSINIGQPVSISMTFNKIGGAETDTEIYYFTQILDKDGFVTNLQSKKVSLASSHLVEVANDWVPGQIGSHTVNSFLWSLEGQSIVPLVQKVSLTANVKPQSQDGSKIVSFCEKKCDYSYLQTAIDRNHKAGNTILVKDGIHSISKPIKIYSNTRLEFSENALIEFKGGSGLPVFVANKVQNVELINPKIKTKESGVTAISFNASKMIKIYGGELNLVQGGESAGFSCADCKNVVLSGMTIKYASRLVDISTNARENNGESTNIWILNGKYSFASIEAIKVNYSTNVYIIGNSVSESADNGIDVGYNFHSLVRDNHIVNAGVPYGSAIHTDSANLVDITGNIVNGTTNDGVTVYRASDVNVLNNTIVDSGNGIAIIAADEPSSQVKVSNNHIIKTRNYGIFVSANQRDVEIIGNRLEQVMEGRAIGGAFSEVNIKVEENIV